MKKRIVFLLTLSTCISVNAQDSYTPIASGANFPVKEVHLEFLREAQDVHSQREHLWNLWASINEEAPSGGPLWETWLSADHVFRPSESEVLAPPKVKNFERPLQFVDLPSSAVPEAPGQSQFATVLFNQEAHDFVRSQKLYLAATLDEINRSLTQQAVSLDNRDIPDFPRESVVLKTVWLHVAANGRTPIPVWDFNPSRPDQSGNDIGTWPRSVVVDTTGETIQRGILDQGRKVVPLTSFYSVELTNHNLIRNSSPGDHMILIAMHVTTKEIRDWVWGTFWWHDKADFGPYALNKTQNLRGVWRNYLMDVAFDSDIPREYEGSANAVINPYLEARFPMGMTSNCMTCHRKSAWPLASFLPIERGKISTSDQRFENRVRLDFLWSLGMRAK